MSSEESVADLLRPYLERIRVPGQNDKVYKDECVYSFDLPDCETGLYVCLNSFYGLGFDYVTKYNQRTGNAVYLHIKKIKKCITPSQEVTEDPPTKKPTRLAIGIQGGFESALEDKYEYEQTNTLVILPQFKKIALPNPQLPLTVQLSVAGVLSADTASKKEEILAWDGEKRLVSHHAQSLLQLDSGIKIPPRGWKCQNCDKTDNLWLNLTDGSILCGRRYFDGSGGNNHALEHYDVMKYPLAVKLGTITSNGADVFSYSEDTMVEDPLLQKHLQHFGINMMKMEKSDKTMTELEIDLNTNFEWDTIQESGSNLTPLYGPDHTGMQNLGNSCYMNSVMQVVYSIPQLTHTYTQSAEQTFELSNNPPDDFNVQMCKLATGLHSGVYSKPPPQQQLSADCGDSVIQTGIRPRMFKSVIGRGHPEFSTCRQQDAAEFFLHLLEKIERSSRGFPTNPADVFKFTVEDRVQCLASNSVMYNTRSERILELPIPLDKALNKEEYAEFESIRKVMEKSKLRMKSDEIVRPIITLPSCLEAYSCMETLEDFYSTATRSKGLAAKSTKLATFPKYLMVQLRKFYLSDDWVPMKLDVSLEIPDEIDLDGLRAHGLQAGEEVLPQDSPATQQIQINMQIVNQLVEMGFSVEACKRAAVNTNNSDTETAMQWLLEHMTDPDLNDPLQLEGVTTDEPVDPENLSMVMSMGFTIQQAEKALRATNNNMERAVDWIFSHIDDLEQPAPVVEEAPPVAAAATGQTNTDPSLYELRAFISHMGTSTSCGHYVCHVKRNGQWIIYNDQRVAVSEKPPRNFGYLYLYRRKDLDQDS